MPQYHMRSGAQTYGHAVGCLMIEADEPYIPGDVANASSYDYPVLFRRVPGTTVERITTGDPELESAVVETAQALVSQGVKGITSNCGFMLKFQKAAADAVDVPVFLSSLMQLPFVAAAAGEGRPIGIITAMSNRLGNDLLELSGVRPDTQIAVAGLQDRPEFRGVLEKRGVLDSDKLEQEMVDAAHELQGEHPDLAAIVLECALLPPYARAVQDATGLPVYDFMTLIDYFHAGSHRHRYEGAY